MKSLRTGLLPVVGAVLLSSASANAQPLLNVQGALVDVKLGGDALSITALSAPTMLDVSLGGNSLVHLPNSANGDPLQVLTGQLGGGQTPVDGLLAGLGGSAGGGASLDLLLGPLLGGGAPSLPGLELLDQLAGGGDLPLDPAMLTGLLAGGGGDVPLDVVFDLLAMLDLEALPLDALDPVTDAAPVNPVELVDGLATGSADDPGQMLQNLLGAVSGGAIVPTEAPNPQVVLGLVTGLLAGGGGDVPLDPAMVGGLVDGLLAGGGDLPLDPAMLTDLLGGGGGLPMDPAQAAGLLTGLLLNPEMLLVLLSAAGDLQLDPATVAALANGLATNLLSEAVDLAGADLPL